MGQNKSLNSLSDQELLDILENNKEKKEVKFHSDVLSFLSVFKITTGKYKVLSRLMYELYKEWSKDPITEKKFIVQLKYHIRHELIRQKLTWFINSNSLLIKNKVYEIKASRSRPVIKVPKYQAHFHAFFKAKNINKGTEWIENYLLYFLYDKWCYETYKKMHLSQKHFLDLMKIHFQIKRPKDRPIMIGIDVPINKLMSEETLDNLRKAHKKQHEKPKKEPRRFKKEVPKVKKERKEELPLLERIRRARQDLYAKKSSGSS